jgi:signal transduction histidine kinase
MGLGLTITKFIVEKLNGELEMKSEYNIGTQFTIKFKISN